MTTAAPAQNAPASPSHLLPPDESVVPPNVRAQAERARLIHEAAYKQAEPAQSDAQPATPPDGQTENTPSDQSVTPAQPVPEANAQAPAAPAAQPGTPPEQQAPPPATPSDPNRNWEHDFYSMKGRFEQSQRNNGALQEQLSEMGNELMRLQQFVGQQGQQSLPQTPSGLTPEDEAAYGPEMIDLIKRATQQAIAPLQQENAELRQRVVRQDKNSVMQALEGAVPSWRQINSSPQFKRWLSLPDLYSGNIRQKLLMDAYQAADAPRVVSFFRGFLRDEAVTGNAQVSTPPAQQPVPQAPTREAAVPLTTIASPGRARPVSEAQSQTPADKPVFTRTDVKRFYDDVRSGKWAGRDAEKAAFEQALFAAQREGRVR